MDMDIHKKKSGQRRKEERDINFSSFSLFAFFMASSFISCRFVRRSSIFPLKRPLVLVIWLLGCTYWCCYGEYEDHLSPLSGHLNLVAINQPPPYQQTTISSKKHVFVVVILVEQPNTMENFLAVTYET